ncbi:MAG: hypothetical protein SWY16_16615 [Cyanobacteriota bacterium]|nr:hypothetical protein [Cyanobacteriota bacterium]
MKRIKTLLLALTWLCAFYYLSYSNTLKPFEDGDRMTLDRVPQVAFRSR